MRFGEFLVASTGQTCFLLLYNTASCQGSNFDLVDWGGQCIEKVQEEDQNMAIFLILVAYIIYLSNNWY